VLVVRITECLPQPDKWGWLELTIDFGDGSFPPIERTERVMTPLWDRSAFDNPYVPPWASPMETACEVGVG